MEAEYSSTELSTAAELPLAMQSEAEVEELGQALSPEFRDQIESAFGQLNQNLFENREGSVVVWREDAGEIDPQAALARRVMMAGLGVRDFRVEQFPSESSPEGRRFLERISTNLPGVEIVYADMENGGRAITLAVNHDPSGQTRVAPTDIERVLRSAHTHTDWMKSVEQFGPNWARKQAEVGQAQLLAIDIDECILPGVDRRVASTEQIEQLAMEIKKANELGMTVVFNTGRSAIETQKVIDYFAKIGTMVSGAITEGGAISIRPNEEGQWIMERNPTVSEEQWQAIQDCKEFLNTNYIASGLGYQEPKVSAVTFNLIKESGTTGQEIVEQLRQLLMAHNLPTTVVDKADVSDGGLQLFAGVDKAEGMRHLQAATGIPKEQTIAIGDSPGDLPMFSESAITAAPYNAKLREMGEPVDYQSPFDAEYGVVDIIRQIIRLKQLPALGPTPQSE